MGRIRSGAAGAGLFAAGVVAGLGLSLSAARVGETANATETAPPPGYLVVMGRDYDREDLRPYAAELPPVYAQYGGTYLAVSTDMEVFEGSYPYQSIVISKWPSLDAARAFWTSAEYAQVRKLREGVGAFDVIAFSGLPEATQRAPLAANE